MATRPMVCVCSPGQIQRYMNKISGPLLDRIDIQCEITPVPFKDISKAQPGEPSSAIRERVIKARQRQELRYKDIPGVHCNAQMTERMIHQYAEPDEAGISYCAWRWSASTSPPVPTIAS